MIGLRNWHWLAKAQLARRGGNKGQNRIPPDSADGYIMALRHANAPHTPDKNEHGDGYQNPTGLCLDKTNPAAGAIHPGFFAYHFYGPGEGPG